jgi:hypothetical protein
LLDAAFLGEREDLTGVVENIIVGQPVKVGTGRVNLVMKGLSAPAQAGKTAKAERPEKSERDLSSGSNAPILAAAKIGRAEKAEKGE